MIARLHIPRGLAKRVADASRVATRASRVSGGAGLSASHGASGSVISLGGEQRLATWFGVIQDKGPDQEPEPSGARYWVRRYNIGGDHDDYDKEVQPEIHDLTSGGVGQVGRGKLSAQPYIARYFVTATNLAELVPSFVEVVDQARRYAFDQPEKSTHELVSGMIVEVREVGRRTSEGIVRQFVFHKEPDRATRIATVLSTPNENRTGTLTDELLCEIADWPFVGYTEKGENDAGVTVHCFMYPGAGSDEGVANAYPMVNGGSLIQVSRYTSQFSGETNPSVKWHCLYPFQVASDECQEGGA